MSPLEHYRRAEELLAAAAGETDSDRDVALEVDGVTRYRTPLELLAMAAVHARLAGIGNPSGAEQTGRPASMGRPL